MAEVKARIRAKYGSDLEDFDDEGEAVHDADGTAWNLSVDRGVGEQREACDTKLAFLEDGVQEVKVLYRARYGDDFDNEEDSLCDADGTQWVNAAA